jgi:rare lipoprotein A
MRTDTDVPNTISVKLGAALAALALTIPASTAAADPNPGGLSFGDPTAPTVFPDGSTLTAPLAEMLGDVVRFEGSLAGAHAGDPVAVQRLGAHGWTTAATATAGVDGAFVASWRPRHSGRTSVRVVRAPRGATVRAATDAGPARAVTVYKPVTATWYGPGFYGKRTACGQRLTSRLLGVAHRSLPCGTPVELYKDGRAVTVPVVDRGPFRRGTTYDLTAATAKTLGVSATTRLGAVHG